MEKLINDNTIIKDELYNIFKNSIECSLCLNILINPVMCLNCQNAFCKKCIDNWSKKSQQCPNRCDNPNYQKSIGKNDILSKIKIKCKGCGNPIEYENVDKHYNTCCPDKLKEDDNKIEIEEVNNTPNSKFEKITKEEIDKLKKEGNEIAYITGKIFIIIIFK